MQLFYDASLPHEFQTHLINDDESKHILRVLRKKIGDSIKITNGKGCLFEVEIIDTKSKRCEIKYINKTIESPLPYQLHIAIAPPKSSDRFEFFLEKVTEIGVTEITPLLCTNSERKRINLKRSLRILQSAMKQSQRLYLPQLNDLISIDQFITSDFGNSTKLIAHCEKHNKTSLKEKTKTSKKYCGLIGPEGDFSHQEIESALKHGFHAVSLGDKRLRTETAGLFLSQALAFKFRL